MKASAVICPGLPTTLKFRMISVPEPDNAPAWKPETVKCPGLLAFGVTNMLLLNVPAVVMQALAAHAKPPAGVTTAGL
jgi:hypothetical protein